MKKKIRNSAKRDLVRKANGPKSEIRKTKKDSGQVRKPASAKKRPPLPPRERRGVKKTVVKRQPNYQAKAQGKYQQFGEAARVLYVEQGRSLSWIARESNLPVSLKTLRIWCLKWGWDAQKEAVNETPQSMQKTILRAMQAVISKINTSLDEKKEIPASWLDALSKSNSILKDLSGNAYFGGHLMTTMNLLDIFLDGLGKHELRKELADALRGFPDWALNQQDQRSAIR